MYSCSNSDTGAELSGFLGGASVRDARSYGGPYTEYPHGQQADRRSDAGKTSAQLGHTANLLRVWTSLWRLLSLSSQVVARRKQFTLRRTATIWVSALALSALSGVACAREITDVTVRTGVQLKERLDQEYKDKNGAVAVQYFLCPSRLKA